MYLKICYKYSKTHVHLPYLKFVIYICSYIMACKPIKSQELQYTMASSKKFKRLPFIFIKIDSKGCILAYLPLIVINSLLIPKSNFQESITEKFVLLCKFKIRFIVMLCMLYLIRIIISLTVFLLWRTETKSTWTGKIEKTKKQKNVRLLLCNLAYLFHSHHCFPWRW